MDNKKENMTYAKAMEELQKIVEDINKGNISIDELAEKIKRATQLIKFCKEKLKNTQEEVEEILKGMNETQK